MIGKKILVIGELNIDMILNNIAGFPTIGEEIIAEDFSLQMGSSSAILASNIAVLGVDTSFCGMVGNDSSGSFILDELRKKGVKTEYVIQSEKYKTGLTIVLNYGQDRANVTYCGAMEAFTIEDVCFNQFSDFDHMHFSSYFLQKGIQKDVPFLFKMAKEKGLTTSLDLQWDPENKWNFPFKECLPYVDLFLPNEKEILALTGQNNIEPAIDIIGESGNCVIVKQGEKGASGYYKGKSYFSKPFLHNQFVDAIGAGDSFNAGFLSKYLSGGSIPESLEAGNMAGAVNTTAPGGTTAFSCLSAFEKMANKLLNINL